MDQVIAIVVPCYNRARLTKRFLENLQQQRERGFKLFLCDSGSTDETPDLLKNGDYSFEAQVLTASRKDFWTGATALGVKVALEQGYRYIMTINDDSVFLEDFLSRFKKIFLTSSFDVLGCRIDVMKYPGLVWGMGAKCNWGTASIFETNFGNQMESALPEGLQHGISHAQALCGNGVIFKAEVFEKIGNYAEFWTPHYHADTEITLRANAAGFQVGVTADVVLYNDVGDDRHMHLFKSQKSIAVRLYYVIKRNFQFFLFRGSMCYLPAVFYICIRYGHLKGLVSALKFLIIQWKVIIGRRYFPGIFGAPPPQL